MRKKRRSFLKNLITFRWLAVLPVLFYKKCVSPLLPNVCIYYPSCSTYMLDAIGQYGLKGVLLGLRRLLRCRPGKEGGYDPVPLNRKGDIKWLC